MAVRAGQGVGDPPGGWPGGMFFEPASPQAGSVLSRGLGPPGGGLLQIFDVCSPAHPVGAEVIVRFIARFIACRSE